MKVPRLKEFVTRRGSELQDALKYLSVELVQNLSDLADAFSNIEFGDNFQSFQWSGTIDANTEIAIRNQLRGAVTPTKRIFVRGDQASLSVTDGDATWDKNFVYLKNTHPTDSATLTVVFLK